MIQRPYLQEIAKRISEPRKFIQVLYGPRQVGKTTMIKQALQVYEKPYLFDTADDIQRTTTYTIGTKTAMRLIM